MSQPNQGDSSGRPLARPAGVPPLPNPPVDLVERLNVAAPRYTSYPTVPEWSESFGPADYAAALAEAGRSAARQPFSIYVHIPFCKEMCLYCGCNVVVAQDPRQADRYLDDLAREIDLAAGLLGARRASERVHWGGGTPTFLSIAQLERLWRLLTGAFEVRPGAEVAIEVDPVVTSHDQLSALAELGFNRLSMGVQDFDPRVQQAVHRVQSFDQTLALREHARKVGFKSVNVDLIYGLPFQTVESWRPSLERVLQLEPDRMAVFSFAYVPRARPHQRKLPVVGLPPTGDKLGLFRLAYETFCAAGYLPVGMDHFARPEDELAQAAERGTLGRDFQGYTLRAGESLAFGITGISDIGSCFAQTSRGRTVYHDALAGGRFAIERGIRLSADDRRRRAIITALMCNFRIDLAAEAADFALELEDLKRSESEGLVVVDGGRIEATPLGRMFIRNVAMVFDAYLRRRSGDRPVFSRVV